MKQTPPNDTAEQHVRKIRRQTRKPPDAQEVLGRREGPVHLGSIGVSAAAGERAADQPRLHRDEGGRRVQRQDDGAQPALADRLHVSEGDRLGLILPIDHLGRLLALHRRVEAVHDDEGGGRHRDDQDGAGGIGTGRQPEPAAAAVGQRIELRRRRPGDMAWAAEHQTLARRAQSSDDAGQDRALASDDEEPDLARKLLLARRHRGEDR